MTLPSYVQIGRGTYGADVAFHRWGDETISIGNYCALSQGIKILAGGGHKRENVSIYPFDVLMRGATTASAEDRCYEHGDGIVIGSDVHVGYSATICGQVRVGNGAVIAANATVFMDVPDYGIAVGNPARVTKYRFDVTTVEALLRVAWWQWPDELIRERIDWFYLPIHDFIHRCESIRLAEYAETVMA